MEPNRKSGENVTRYEYCQNNVLNVTRIHVHCPALHLWNMHCLCNSSNLAVAMLHRDL